MKCHFLKQAHITGASDSISQEQIRKIDFQMTYSICSIIHNNSRGTGFFCRIPFPDNYTLLPVLITCNHVLDEESISNGKKINFIFNDKSYSLLIDNSRKKYTDKIKDITFIQIKINDNIKNVSFLDIDENFNLHEIGDEKSVYVLHYEYGKYKKFSRGIIVFIKKSKKGFYKIMYSCSTQTGSSGCPIINSSNSKVIGIHKGYEQDFSLNIGMIIEVPKEFYNKYQYVQNSEKEYNILRDYSEYDFSEETKIIEKIEKKEKEIKHNQIEYGKYENNLIKCPQIHEHPFEFYEEINDKCNICLKKIEYSPGYGCNYCSILLCLDCNSTIFYGKNMNPHEHPLKLISKNNNWYCNLCGSHYLKKDITFCCQECDFDACCFCYLNGNNKSKIVMIQSNRKIHKHPLYYKAKLNKTCSFCDEEIENKQGYKCNECDIILCFRCYLLIYHQKKNYIHQHDLILSEHLFWTCNICMNDYTFQASCGCWECDFDICYLCYSKTIQN